MMCGACVDDDDRDLAGERRDLADDAARLHRGRDQPLLAVALLDDDGRLGEDAVGLAALTSDHV